MSAIIRTDLEGIVVVHLDDLTTLNLKAGDLVPDGATVGDHLLAPAPVEADADEPTTSGDEPDSGATADAAEEPEPEKAEAEDPAKAEPAETAETKASGPYASTKSTRTRK
jgi:hypothetical protein